MRGALTTTILLAVFALTLFAVSYGHTSGPAALDCSDASLDGPWLVIVSGVEPYTYSVYLTFDGQGTIDDIGSFNIPDSAGAYAVAANCDISGTMWSDGYIPFTGHVLSDSTGDIDMGLGSFPMLKVRDVGALEGCWTGAFVQDTTFNVTLEIDEFGSIQSSTGFVTPVTGKMFFESGYLAGHIFTGEPLLGWEELNLRDATVVDDSSMTGTFALDCSDCPEGTFSLVRCALTAARDEAQMLILRPNFPNPFNPQTTIAYSVPRAGRVTLQVFDVAGRLVATLFDGDRAAGRHTASWGGRDAAGVAVGSGVYFVRLEAGGVVRTQKVVLLK